MVNVNDECLVFHIFRLQTMTESTWKILKLDWKTFFFQKSGNPATTHVIVNVKCCTSPVPLHCSKHS